MSINVDARGLACPQPVIATKKALENITDGLLVILVDNAAAKENVSKFAIANGCSVDAVEKDGIYTIKIIKGKGERIAEAPAPQFSKDKLVYFVGHNTLGHGSSELGNVLIKSFFYTLTEKEPLPSTIIFANSGVFLTSEGSPVLVHLTQLAERGVEILSCGTCLDYYHLKNHLQVGTVTNMYNILEQIANPAVKTITL
ncbi:sulfurtransferase tusa [Lucifera butyrica]|uniref:Sulfurtransferase tusa n=1 Tax=Lucifera butyrica TaxID=1351585 RepID=A0A498R992_9FIRM|nr:sulfurtransferase-like selenium metabolism protein YedF [Lucifera butyrica]VBB07517.1 sulfurtransferase tusa [Lucifera butyrica]